MNERGRTELAEEDWDDDAPTAVFRVGHDTHQGQHEAQPETPVVADNADERITLLVEDYRELLALANAHSR